MNTRVHWESLYSTKAPEELGWYERHLRPSLSMIRSLGIPKAANIIDVGGGASTLVHDLLSDGFRSVTILDVSASALSCAQSRLGDRARNVTWIEADITSVSLPLMHYDLWHDRALFHFLTTARDRKNYVDVLCRSVKLGGRIIIGTFSLEAPPKCSGSDVVRYGPEHLQEELGDNFKLLEQTKELHVTPRVTEQMYLYCLFEKLA